MASPAFMVGVSGSLDVDFDDWDEIKDHPMAAPAMVNFADLFEGMVGASREDVLALMERKGELEAARDAATKTGPSAKSGILDGACLALEVLDALSEAGQMELRVLLPDRGLIEFKLDAPGLQKAALLGWAMGPMKAVLERLDEEKEGNTEDDFVPMSNY